MQCLRLPFKHILTLFSNCSDSVASRALTATVRVSKLSVALETLASRSSAAFAVAVRASAHRSQRRRREGPFIRG